MLDPQQRSSRKKLKLFCSLLVLSGLIGCGSGQQSRSAGKVPRPLPTQGYQRFIPIAHGQGFLSFPYWAFDTKTGQLCKTWDWQSNSAAAKRAQESGNASGLTGLDAAAQDTETCKYLWKTYPDNGQQ